jgi:hypothetical protein
MTRTSEIHVTGKVLAFVDIISARRGRIVVEVNGARSVVSVGGTLTVEIPIAVTPTPPADHR